MSVGTKGILSLRGRHVDRRRLEAAGIWLTHGVLDGLSTLIAHRRIGPHLEPNPLVRSVLYEHGGMVAFALLVAVCSAVALVYPTFSRVGQFPRWFGPALISIGALTSIGNLISTWMTVGLIS